MVPLNAADDILNRGRPIGAGPPGNLIPEPQGHEPVSVVTERIVVHTELTWPPVMLLNGTVAGAYRIVWASPRLSAPMLPCSSGLASRESPRHATDDLPVA